MAETDKKGLGYIGMGAMGSRMAGRLLDAGYDLTVYNRERERTNPLVRRGAKVAATPGELASEVEVVLTSVTDDTALEEVMFGPEGALQTARQGTIFIQMSTVSPGISMCLFEEAKTKGISVLDAMVSGSTPQAEQGQLVIFVGGQEETYHTCRPIFAVLGRESFYMGPSGAGAIMKLCVNALLGMGMQALAEAVSLGLKAGLPGDLFLRVLGETAVLSPSQKTKLENAAKNKFPPTFPVSLMFKDYGLILQEAMEYSVPMPATAAAAQVCAAENARQRNARIDEDFSSIIRTMRQMAGQPD